MVRVYDVVSEADVPWIVMEYVPSRTLQDLLDADGPLPPQRAARIGLALLDALRAAHDAGVLHRDVKPANVLVADDGRVLLTDFGLAVFDGGDQTMTGPGTILGSPQYVAPERAAEGVSSEHADLWSLGATLHAAVEGRAPYARSTARPRPGPAASPRREPAGHPTADEATRPPVGQKNQTPHDPDQTHREEPDRAHRHDADRSHRDEPDQTSGHDSDRIGGSPSPTSSAGNSTGMPRRDAGPGPGQPVPARRATPARPATRRLRPSTATLRPAMGGRCLATLRPTPAGRRIPAARRVGVACRRRRIPGGVAGRLAALP